MRITGTGARIRAVTAIGAVLLLVSACSSSAASTAPSAPAAVASTAPAASGGAGAAIAVAMANGSVGDYLTGPNGKTLYVFTPDSANTSTCTDTCAQTWPPFTVSAGDTSE